MTTSLDKLAGAVEDLFGGAPGKICFLGDAKTAVGPVTRAFDKNERFVSAKLSGTKIQLLLRSPFKPKGPPESFTIPACR